jgi:hypothetical protein
VNGYAVGLLSGAVPASMFMIGDVGLVLGPGARAPNVLSGVIGGGVPSDESDAVESERCRPWCPPRPTGMAIGAECGGDTERVVEEDMMAEV